LQPEQSWRLADKPATQFEVTSTPTSLNYDVSIAAGFNVESYVALVGGGWIVPGTPATDIAACLTAGCKADLNATCPADLKVVSSDEPNKTIGCLDPCTQCQRSAGNLDCPMTFPGETYTDCNGGTGSVTYQDMYCAKNMVDGNAQASPNQGTATAFGPSDPATSSRRDRVSASTRHRRSPLSRISTTTVGSTRQVRRRRTVAARRRTISCCRTERPAVAI
jgi:hypothetical protein